MKHKKGAQGLACQPAKDFKLKPLAAAVSLAALSSASIPTISYAQDGARALEEVVVTASRRSTSVQDVPINIASVSGAQIEEMRIDDLTELAASVPGLTVVDQGARGSNLVIVRGLNTDVLSGSEAQGNNDDSTVATYLGDIPLFVDLKLNDIERVEVLLGPQGTLYGSGTLGGAIRFIPRKPDTSETTFEIRGDVSSFSESDDLTNEFGFTANIPLSETVAIRANVDRLDAAGFVDYNFLVRESGVSNPEPDFTDAAAVAANLTSREDANTEETLSARISLLWEINDQVSALFGYHLQDQEAGARQINHRDAFNTGRYESAHRFLEPNDRKNELYSLEVVADLGFAELTSATGYSEYEDEGQRDQTDLLLDILPFYGDFPAFSAFTLEEQEEERFNQELRLVSTSDSKFSWIVGGFYNSYDIFESSKEFTPGLPGFFGVDPVVDGEVVSEPIEFFAAGPTETEEVAFFGEFGYQITDQWQITVGGRWYDYELLEGGFTQFPLFPVINAPDTVNEVSDDGTLFKFNTSYYLANDVMIYGTVSEGYRIGGVNRFPICTQQQIDLNSDNDPSNDIQAGCIFSDQLLISPDETTNYEIGLRSSWLKNRLTVNAAIYQIEWEEIQVGGFTPFSSENITLNGGTAISEGIELSVSAAVSDRLTIRGSYAYNQAELDSDAESLVDGEDAFSGDRLSGSPEHQASFFANYGFPLQGDLNIDINYGLTYQSDVLTRIGQRAGGEELDGFTLQNLSVVLSNDTWSLTAYVDNLADEYGETAARDTPQETRQVSANNFTVRRNFKNIISPRNFGLSFTYRFQ